MRGECQSLATVIIVVFSVDGNGRITTKGFDDEEQANDYYRMEYVRLAQNKK